MWREWWIERRNAILADPRFQRFALRCAPMRPVARRHAARLFDLVAGFTYSQTLFACVELNLFERLATGSVKLADLAAATGLPEQALGRLVVAAAALDLLEPLDGEWVTLGVAGAALRGNPGVAAMVAHHHLLYRDLADPVSMLRSPGGGALSRFWAYAQGDDPVSVSAYSSLMAASNVPVAEQVFAAYDLRRHRRLLDVGGGEGRFLAEVRVRAPHLELGLFDLAAVVARARAALEPGVAFHSGDFRRDSLPGGYDCITLVRILHDHDDDVVMALLRAIRAALAPGGTLLIAEPMLDTPGAERVGATYFGWYFQAMGQGRARSPRDIGTMLKMAGFRHWRRIPTQLPLQATLVLARM